MPALSEGNLFFLQEEWQENLRGQNFAFRGHLSTQRMYFCATWEPR